MSNNWLKKLKDSKEKLFFESIALEVYNDIAQKIADNNSLSNAESKRKKLYTELEEIYDQTEDSFIKLVIAHSFVTGEYHILSNLSKFGNLDVYRGTSGKRYNEFSKQVYESAISIVEFLISNDVQFRLAHEIVKIAVQRVNKNTKANLKEKILSWVNTIELGPDEELSVSKIEFLIPAINYLLEDKSYRTSELLSIIDSMLIFSINQGDTAKSERANFNSMGFDCIFPCVFQLKIKYYQKLNDELQVKKVGKQFAETHENLGNKRAEKGDIANIEGATIHYESAVGLYQKFGLKEELSLAKRTLDNLKQIFFSMENPNSIERYRNLLEYLPEEERSWQRKILDDFENLSFNDQIQQLLLHLPKISKNQIAQFRKANPFSEVVSAEIKNEHEQTTFKADNEETKESYALFNYIQQNMLLCGQMLQKMLEKDKKISLSETFGKVELISKRQYLFIKAFELFFSGDFCPALYILTPQVEWWFREVTYNAGGQTSNLNHFPTEQAKTLTPIFESNELKEFLGDDQHWLFEQLMNKEPMNIRNKVAHGLDIFDNGYCTYFTLCILKMVFEKTTE